MIRILLILLFISIPAHADDFFFNDMSGKPIRLANYRGKWVLVNFFSMTDADSTAELPDLVSLQNAHKNIVVIGVVMNWKNAQSVAAFAKTNHLPYTIALGNDDIVDQIGDFPRLPANFLYSPSGDLAAARSGSVTKDDIERLIK
jgi:peroxiredoxin